MGHHHKFKKILGFIYLETGILDDQLLKQQIFFLDTLQGCSQLPASITFFIDDSQRAINLAQEINERIFALLDGP